MALLKAEEEELRRVSVESVLLATPTGCYLVQNRSDGDTDCSSRIVHLLMICWSRHLPMDSLLLLRRIHVAPAV